MSYEEEFCKIVGRAYFAQCVEGNDEDYIIDPGRARTALEIFDYCESLATRNGGSVEGVISRKKDEPAEIAIRFVNDLIIGDEKNSLRDFIAVLSKCEAININGTGLEDGSFLISFFVDNPYQKKEIKNTYTE